MKFASKLVVKTHLLDKDYRSDKNESLFFYEQILSIYIFFDNSLLNIYKRLLGLYIFFTDNPSHGNL